MSPQVPPPLRTWDGTKFVSPGEQQQTVPTTPSTAPLRTWDGTKFVDPPGAPSSQNPVPVSAPQPPTPSNQTNYGQRPTTYGLDATGAMQSMWDGSQWRDLYSGKVTGSPSRTRTDQPEAPYPEETDTQISGAAPSAQGTPSAAAQPRILLPEEERVPRAPRMPAGGAVMVTPYSRQPGTDIYQGPRGTRPVLIQPPAKDTILPAPAQQLIDELHDVIGVGPFAEPFEALQQIATGIHDLGDVASTQGALTPGNVEETRLRGAAALTEVGKGGLRIGSVLVPYAAIKAPVQTVATLAGYAFAQKGVELGAEAVGVPKEYAELGAEAAGVVGAAATARATDLVGRIFGPGGRFGVPVDIGSLNDQQLLYSYLWAQQHGDAQAADVFGYEGMRRQHAYEAEAHGDANQPQKGTAPQQALPAAPEGVPPEGIAPQRLLPAAPEGVPPEGAPIANPPVSRETGTPASAAGRPAAQPGEPPSGGATPGQELPPNQIGPILSRPDPAQQSQTATVPGAGGSAESFWRSAQAVPGNVGGVPVVSVNNAAMALVARAVNPMAETALGWTLTPDERSLLTRQGGISAGIQNPTAFDAALAEVARVVVAMPDGPVVLVQTGPSISEQSLRQTVEEEKGHILQMQLPGGLAGIPTAPLDTGLGAHAVRILGLQGYIEPLAGSKYYNEQRAVMAAEVSVRLMVPDRHPDLGLTRQQARELAGQFIQALVDAHGQKAQDVIGRIYANLEASEAESTGIGAVTRESTTALEGSPGQPGTPGGRTGQDFSGHAPAALARKPTPQSPLVPGGKALVPATASAGAPSRAQPATPHKQAPLQGAQSGQDIIRGSSDIPLSEQGEAEARDVAQRTAGQFDVIRSSPLKRAYNTASAVADTNPQAGTVQKAGSLTPWYLGAYEGKPTAHVLNDLNDLIRNKPSQVPVGRGTQSTQDGQSFNSFRRDTLGDAQDQIDRYNSAVASGSAPQTILNATHYRDLRLLQAWAAKGMPADLSVDADEMTRQGDVQPGELFRLDPQQRTLAPAADASQPGIYYLRHGATKWNAENNAPPGASPQLQQQMAISPTAPGSSAPAKGQPGWVGWVSPSELAADAVRFQFKRNVGQGGAGQKLKSARVWNEDMAGTAAVWRDPANGKSYIINGHHRLDLANRLGAPRMLVKYIKADNASQARMYGALLNIGDDQGDAVDAAKVFREGNIGPSDLEQYGVAVGGRVASDGMAIANLAQPLFDKVASGEMSIPRGSAIGAGLPNHQDQLNLANLLESRRAMSDGDVAELIRLSNLAPRRTEHTENLFGEHEMERSLLPERAQVSDYIRVELKREKRLFQTVAGQAAADKLAAGGNVIMADKNAIIAKEAGAGVLLYDRLSGSAGPIGSILDAAAGELADGKNANTVKQGAYRAVRNILAAQLAKLGGVGQPESQPPGNPPAMATGGATPGQELPPNQVGRTPQPPLTPGGSEQLKLFDMISQARNIQGATERVVAQDLAQREKDLSDKGFGERLRTWVTGARDAEIAGTNQLRDALRKALPNPVDQEALTLIRDFKHRPGELQQFLDGTHPYYDEVASMAAQRGADPIAAKSAAIARVQSVRAAIERALAPTAELDAADGVMTAYFEDHLAEGHRMGFINSNIGNDEYVTHLLQPRETEDFGKRMARGPALGPRQFKFARQRSYPTVLHAIANGIRPRTLNALDAMTIYGERFGATKAGRMLVAKLKELGFGHWGTEASKKDGGIPREDVELAPETRYFRNEVPFITKKGAAAVAHQTLFVPPMVEEALRPIYEYDYMNRVRGYMPARMFQSYLKSVELALSFFHIKALNMAAISNMRDPGQVAKAMAVDMESPQFQQWERAWIARGLTTSILARTWEAYRALQPSTAPTRMEVVRSWPVVRRVDQSAAAVSHFTFDVLQRKFKVMNANFVMASWFARHPGASDLQISEAMRVIAKEMNAVYGGLHWENLGINRTVLNLARGLYYAPDWTFSNFASAKTALLGSGAGWKTGPGPNAAGGPEDPGARAARLFWLRGTVWMLGLSAATTLMLAVLSRRSSKEALQEWAKDPTSVYMGRDAKGLAIRANYYFTGAHGDAVKLIKDQIKYPGLVGLARTMAGKLGPFGRTGEELMSNTNELGQPIIERSMRDTDLPLGPRGGVGRRAPTALEKTGAGFWQLGKNAAPVPFGFSTVLGMLMDKRHDWGPQDYASAIINGRPPVHDGEKSGQKSVATPGTPMGGRPPHSPAMPRAPRMPRMR